MRQSQTDDKRQFSYLVEGCNADFRVADHLDRFAPGEVTITPVADVLFGPEADRFVEGPLGGAKRRRLRLR